MEDLGLIPGLGRSTGEGKGYPLQYFGLENFMDYAVHGVSKSRQTELNDFHFLHNHIYVVVVKFISILLKAKLIVLIYPIIFTKKYTCFLLKKLYLYHYVKISYQQYVWSFS